MGDFGKMGCAHSSRRAISRTLKDRPTTRLEKIGARACRIEERT
jgi:hypothetical protein